jgi:hypothetical protein
MNSELNKKIEERIEELSLLNVSNRYRVGYYSADFEGQQAYALWDKKQNRLRYITNKKWKVKLGLLVARLFGWKIIVEI